MQTAVFSYTLSPDPRLHYWAARILQSLLASLVPNRAALRCFLPRTAISRSLHFYFSQESWISSAKPQRIKDDFYTPLSTALAETHTNTSLTSTVLEIHLHLGSLTFKLKPQPTVHAFTMICKGIFCLVIGRNRVHSKALWQNVVSLIQSFKIQRLGITLKCWYYGSSPAFVPKESTVRHPFWHIT